MDDEEVGPHNLPQMKEDRVFEADLPAQFDGSFSNLKIRITCNKAPHYYRFNYTASSNHEIQ